MRRLFRETTLCLVFAATCLLALPPDVNAQPEGLVSYLDSVTTDEEEARLNTPNLVYSEPVMNEVYILSNDKVYIYSGDLFPLFTLGKGRGIESPQGLAVDAEGNLYIAQGPTKDDPRSRISVFNACAKWVRDIYLEDPDGDGPFQPRRLAVDGKGNIYVAGFNVPGVVVLDSEGRLLETISPERQGEKVHFVDVTLDEAGRIYLVSQAAGQIYVYDENREFLFSFGQKGGSTGKLSRPNGLGVDIRSRRIYVVDYMRHTVSAFDYDDGRFLFEFGGRGWSKGWFQGPSDIDVDPSGRILVADTFNNRVQVFQPRERMISKHLEQLFGELWKDRRAASPEDRRASSPAGEEPAANGTSLTSYYTKDP